MCICICIRICAYVYMYILYISLPLSLFLSLIPIIQFAFVIYPFSISVNFTMFFCETQAVIFVYFVTLCSTRKMFTQFGASSTNQAIKYHSICVGI